MKRDKCRMVVVDGEPVRVYAERAPTKRDREALDAIVRAARQHAAALVGKRRCPHCRRYFKLVRGKFPPHTADCDGPGYPYDCPGRPTDE